MHLVSIPNEELPGINPRYLGWRNCEPGLKKGPVVQPHWFLYYVVSGKGTFYIRDKVYPVTAGQMFVFSPYTQVSYEADEKEPWSYIWVGFDYPGELPVKLEDVNDYPGALRYFSALRQCEKMTGGRSLYLAAQIWELFSHLAENERRKKDFIDEALGFMQSEYAEGITVADIAKRLNMDRSHFSVRFKKRVGTSPSRYLMDIRMRLAATLLSGGTSVSVTATSVGYGDIYIFSKMFRRFYGMSPREYIKLHT